MARSRPLVSALFWAGLALLGAALALLLASFRPAQSMEDLGMVVGAMLLTALAGVVAAAHLLVARLSRAPQPRWRLAASGLACVLGLAVGVALASARFSG